MVFLGCYLHYVLQVIAEGLHSRSENTEIVPLLMPLPGWPMVYTEITNIDKTARLNSYFARY